MLRDRVAVLRDSQDTVRHPFGFLLLANELNLYTGGHLDPDSALQCRIMPAALSNAPHSLCNVHLAELH
jgi:hypothetical protein